VNLLGNNTVIQFRSEGLEKNLSVFQYVLHIVIDVQRQIQREYGLALPHDFWLKKQLQLPTPTIAGL
jgi:hypothetical protein